MEKPLVWVAERSTNAADAVRVAGFFSLGGLGGGKNFVNPPSNTCPPPAEVRPRKFEKFTYIFVLNLTTFELRSTSKSCISCLK